MKPHSELEAAMDLNFGKPDKRSAAVALSESGEVYRGVYLDSQGHLLSKPAEQIALLQSTQSTDYKIQEVIAMYEQVDEDTVASPQTLMILADFARRTGVQMSYKVIQPGGEVLFATEDVRTEIPFYIPKVEVPGYVENSDPTTNVVEIKDGESVDLRSYLHEGATEGSSRAFTTSEKSTSYGSAAISSSNKMYISGQYSSYDHQTNIHAEMGAYMAAYMAGEDTITHLSIISPKFKDKPAQTCGCCRQFLQEMTADAEHNLDVYCFAYNSDYYEQYQLAELLPSNWSSKVG